MSDREYTEQQPKPGECVLWCEHAGRHHFWRTEMEFTRPDGSAGIARWLIQCEGCKVRLEATGEPVVNGDVLWPADGRDATGAPTSSPIVEAPR